MTPEALLARTMVELAGSLADDFDIVDLLTMLSDRCVEVLDVQAAGVMLVSPAGELRVVASSSPTMRSLELLEEQAEEGPCRDSFVTGRPVVNANLAVAEGRWPRFTPKALIAGFRSAHALPMRKRDVTIGALNLFRTDQGELDQPDIAVAQGFADMATITILRNRAMTNVKHANAQLSSVLTDRIVIEQAKGVVSERLGLDMEQAFRLLRRHAAQHARLVDVARHIVNGTLRPDALGPAD